MTRAFSSMDRRCPRLAPIAVGMAAEARERSLRKICSSGQSLRGLGKRDIPQWSVPGSDDESAPKSRIDVWPNEHARRRNSGRENNHGDDGKDPSSFDSHARYAKRGSL
jgi:hypothetical protein